MSEFVIVCDALIFNDKGEALFQKRKMGNKEPMWATPGGKRYSQSRQKGSCREEKYE